MKNDIVIMAELDWDGLHCQSHVIASGFAADGHKVYYINRTLQRWPRLRHLLVRLRPSPSRGVATARTIPHGVKVLNIWVGPPVKWMRWLNRFFIKRAVGNLDFNEPVFITYVPTYNAIDLSALIKPRLKAYVCYHNFDADIVLKDLLASEKKIICEADILFADSGFLINRIKKLAGEKTVYQSAPGVYFDLFKNAYRGDEWLKPHKICFFGGIGAHVDIKCYNRLCDDYEVHFIGVINPDVRHMLDPRIIVSDPVSNDLLPGLLRKMDVLTMLYIRSDYMDGVIPAKFFECIATGKPVLVSGLLEAANYREYVYETNNDATVALKIIQSLPVVHSQSRSENQFRLGSEADFNKRYESFRKIIFGELNEKNKSQG